MVVDLFHVHWACSDPLVVHRGIHLDISSYLYIYICNRMKYDYISRPARFMLSRPRVHRKKQFAHVSRSKSLTRLTPRILTLFALQIAWGSVTAKCCFCACAGSKVWACRSAPGRRLFSGEDGVLHQDQEEDGGCSGQDRVRPHNQYPLITQTGELFLKAVGRWEKCMLFLFYTFIWPGFLLL